MRSSRRKAANIRGVRLAVSLKYIVCATVLSLASQVALYADGPQKLPAPTESDARLQADSKGWRLDRAKITETARPRVLLIGDSILNGYGRQVMSALAGKAYVDAWVNPYCQSEHLNKLLAEVLANGPYDVVHFNMGLHGWQQGRIKDGTFEPLTRAYVQVVRDTLPQAKIIWASSTPVTVKGKPMELDPEINPVIVEHNRMAAQVMHEMNVPVNDFYSLLAPKLELARGDQFHWRPEAYTILAETVTTSVLRELDQHATQRAKASVAAETTGKLAPADDPLQTAPERSFLMGLTQMNFDDSPAGTSRMKETLAKNAEVVAVYLDWGVPWPEAFEGRRFHQNVRREIAAVKQRISPQHQVFLALNAGAFNRREMAGYWGEKTQMPRPGQWADKGLDDPDVITAFGNYCEQMISEFQPAFLCYAIEINMMAGVAPERFDQLVVLAEHVYARLKAKHPKMLVFPTFQIDFGVPGNAGGEQAVRRLMPYSDAIAVSTYPHIRGFTAESLPKGWLADVRKLAPDKVFLVAETGYPAAQYEGTWLFNQQVRVDSSPQKQAAYLRWLLFESNRLDARLVTWFFPEDINSYLENELKRVPEAASMATMAMNLGLYERGFRPRPALDEWKEWWRKRPAQRP